MIETSDPAHPQLNLVFDFNVLTPVLLLPSAIVNLYGVQGEPIKQTIIVRRPDGKPMEIKDVAGLPPEVVLTKEPVTAKNADPPTSNNPARPGDVRLLFAVAQTDKPGSLTAQLKIATNHPDKPELTMPLTVNVQPIVRVTPPRLQVRRDPTAAEATARINLAHAHSKPFRVQNVAVKGDLPGCTASVASGAAGPVQVIEVHSAGEAPAAGIYNGTVMATTDLASTPTIEVPVTLRVIGPPPAPPAKTPVATPPPPAAPSDAPAPRK